MDLASLQRDVVAVVSQADDQSSFRHRAHESVGVACDEEKPQPANLTNRTADGDGLRRGDAAENLEGHQPTVPAVVDQPSNAQREAAARPTAAGASRDGGLPRRHQRVVSSTPSRLARRRKAEVVNQKFGRELPHYREICSQATGIFRTVRVHDRRTERVCDGTAAGRI